MNKALSRIVTEITVKRTKLKVRIDVYSDWTCVSIVRKGLTVEQLQAIIDEIFFFGSVDYHIRFTDLRTVVYVNSSSVCDKYIAN